MDTPIAFSSERSGAPKAKFGHTRGNFVTGREIMVKGVLSNTSYSKRKEIRQKMTYLGKVKGTLIEGSTNVDGINSRYLTPDRKLKFELMRKDLKGLTTAESRATFSNMETWKWKDNHVTLLGNMLRFTLLRKMEEGSSDRSLRGELPTVSDGGFEVDPNNIWTKEYPVGGTMVWPTGADLFNYPEFTLLKAYSPDDDRPVVNLRGLDDEEARFVLMMMGQWQRQSRYRIDFETPKLAERIYYRRDGDNEVPNLTEWMVGSDRGVVEPPVLTSWKVANGALEKYVAYQRLVGQMSVARGLVLRAYCQYLPVTIDGVAWLQTEWIATWPTFEAFRGRYPFLTQGTPTFVSKRGESETWFFGYSLEAHNFAGISICQAIYYGLAIRSFRRSTEKEPLGSYSAFCDPNGLTTAALAEVISAPIPDIGMVGMDVRPSLFTEWDAEVLIWMKKRGDGLDQRWDDGVDERIDDYVVKEAPLETAECPKVSADLKLKMEEQEEVVELMSLIKEEEAKKLILGYLESEIISRAQQYYALEHILRYSVLRKKYLGLREKCETYGQEPLWQLMVEAMKKIHAEHTEEDLNEDDLKDVVGLIYDHFFSHMDIEQELEPISTYKCKGKLAEYVGASEGDGRKKLFERIRGRPDWDASMVAVKRPKKIIPKTPSKEGDKPNLAAMEEELVRLEYEDAKKKAVAETIGVIKVRKAMIEDAQNRLGDSEKKGEPFPMVTCMHEILEPDESAEPLDTVIAESDLEPSKPTLTEEEKSRGDVVVALELEAWPIPGIPTYIRRATGQRGFRLLDGEYILKIGELDRDCTKIRGSMSEIWKIVLMLRLLGWSCEVYLAWTTDGRRKWAYTEDGTVPIPPCQSKSYKGRPVTIKNLTMDSGGAMMSDLLVADKGLELKVEVSPLRETISATLDGTGGKVWITT